MHNDHFEHGNDGKNSLKRFSLWNAPLINHFQGDLIYSIHELDDALYAQYEQSNHPAAKPITQLLKATSTFLHQTSLEKYFGQSNAESKTDDDWKKVFKDIVNELTIAQNQCNEETKNSTGYLVLEAAINYCKHCIADRFRAMETSPNKLQSYYIKYGNELKNIISTSASVSFKY